MIEKTTPPSPASETTKNTDSMPSLLPLFPGKFSFFSSNHVKLSPEQAQASEWSGSRPFWKLLEASGNCRKWA